MDKLIQGDSEVEAKFYKYDDLKSKCGTHTDWPVGKEARVVTVAGTIGCPCGGTHVKNIKEIKNVQVTKISSRKGTVRVCYKLPE